MKKLFALFLFCAFVFTAKAQLIELKSVYGFTSDTVVNTAAISLASTEINGDRKQITIQVEATEISGTTGGSIVIEGSLDGVDYKAIPTVDTQTAITAATAADVTTKQVFVWRIITNHFRYYRVTWTGTGTMSARFFATLLAR